MRFKAIFFFPGFILVVHVVVAEEESKDEFDFDLKELQARYMEAFPHAREFFKFDNSSRSDINRVVKAPKMKEGACMRKTVFSEKQVAKMVEVYGENALLNSTIKDMLKLPRARLFSGENYTGEYEDYHFANAYYKGGCHDLKMLNKTVKSVQTYGKCVRLFRYKRCASWSLAVYPWSIRSHLSSRLEGVQSIGPCLTHEFESSNFGPNSPTFVQKNSSDLRNYIPDLVEFNRFTFATGQLVTVSRGSVKYHALGPKGLVEYLEAHIYVRHYKTSQPTEIMKNSTFYKSLDKHKGDDLCYGIPVSLGGPANETYNIFPASPSAVKQWTAITSRIPPPTTTHVTLVALNFLYENDNQTRPFAFYYFVETNGNEILYGRVLN